MWTKRQRLWGLALWTLAVAALAAPALAHEDLPSESQCQPYIEKALKELESGDAETAGNIDSQEIVVDDDTKEVNSAEDGGEETGDDDTGGEDTGDDDSKEDDAPSVEVADEPYAARDTNDENDSKTEADDSKEDGGDNDSTEDGATDEEGDGKDDGESGEDDDSKETASAEDKASEESDDSKKDPADTADDAKDESAEDSNEDENNSKQDDEDSKEGDSDNAKQESADDEESKEGGEDSKETENDDEEKAGDEEKGDDSKEDTTEDDSGEERIKRDVSDETEDDEDAKEGDTEENEDDDAAEEAIEEDLLLTGEIPENLRSREHITQILRLDEATSEDELVVERAADIVLRDLKKLYENSIKPLEALYKYRDLSNRHFGDPEIFSKPLVLFMGPWSGGKSSIVNYLTGLEFGKWSLRTGAEPSPAYFNILMHGKEPEVLDGTQLAADWTFAGLQKFGQGLEERLRGLKHPSKILEKVNIVEIPGILEVRKQVSRVFPFNDACQWFIDRADIIFLVYDPSKLDVGPETEAILDQLKSRESQTRIILNKADTVKPEELMRVQSALIWNISPLMSSAQPPVMYTVSLWSLPYKEGAPKRLLQAQERELLRDLRTAIDRRIENKIASARRFAVRVRNHAKMVDCYLTTYYNHKTIFGNKKLIADAIIQNPQNYHIYEGLSTLTNISRYDLPDPETYRDFFRLNPLYEFQPLSATCTYFRGCPITQLDVAIAYDLPELAGKYKRMVETATPQGMPKS